MKNTPPSVNPFNLLAEKPFASFPTPLQDQCFNAITRVVIDKPYEVMLPFAEAMRRCINEAGHETEKFNVTPLKLTTQSTRASFMSRATWLVGAKNGVGGQWKLIIDLSTDHLIAIRDELEAGLYSVPGDAWRLQAIKDVLLFSRKVK